MIVRYLGILLIIAALAGCVGPERLSTQEIKTHPLYGQQMMLIPPGIAIDGITTEYPGIYITLGLLDALTTEPDSLDGEILP